MVDISIWLDIMEDKEQGTGTDQTAKQSKKERWAAEIRNEHSANFSKKKKKTLKPLEQAWPYAACYCWVLLKAATYLTSLES